MRDLCELLEWLPADTPGWRILASELRDIFFQVRPVRGKADRIRGQ